MESMNNIPREPQAHLINILRETRGHHPNFALFLGAGASANSNVKLAKDMIKDWRQAHLKQYGKEGETEDQHFKKHHWSGGPEEYSYLFELLYDQPSQRREYIENWLRNASPSWGYIYLVNLIKNRVFNAIFTTNFDDLLNEACYSFSNEVRPIVCAHDSSIKSIRITSARPKIIKLHGDFLFDNIKNTISELETLEANMREKFKQYASEYGLIVVGYSGNDRSVMDAVCALLRQESNFKHGIYWCVRKGSVISEKVEALTIFPRFKIVEIEGFDEFFAEIHEELEQKLQMEIEDPYAALAKKLNVLMPDAKILLEGKKTHSIIERDMAIIGRNIAKLASLNEADEAIDPHKVTEIKLRLKDEKTVNLPIPFLLLARISDSSGDSQNAMFYALKQLNKSSDIRDFCFAFSLMSKYQLGSCKDELMAKLTSSSGLLISDAAASFEIALSLTDVKAFDDAEKVLELGFQANQKSDRKQVYFLPFWALNRYQLVLHRGEQFSPESEAKLLALTKYEGDAEALVRMGAFILLGDAEEATKYLLLAVERKENGASFELLKKWPIIKFLLPKLKDPELITLLSNKLPKDKRESNVN